MKRFEDVLEFDARAPRQRCQQCDDNIPPTPAKDRRSYPKALLIIGRILNEFPLQRDGRFREEQKIIALCLGAA